MLDTKAHRNFKIIIEFFKLNEKSIHRRRKKGLNKNKENAAKNSYNFSIRSQKCRKLSFSGDQKTFLTFIKLGLSHIYIYVIQFYRNEERNLKKNWLISSQTAKVFKLNTYLKFSMAYNLISPLPFL